MTYNIPKCGSAAVGAHTVPNRICAIPTSPRAGRPFMNIYTVMEITAATATKANIVKMTFAITSMRFFVIFPLKIFICASLLKLLFSNLFSVILNALSFLLSVFTGTSLSVFLPAAGSAAISIAGFGQFITSAFIFTSFPSHYMADIPHKK